jgi:hypothetical protein
VYGSQPSNWRKYRTSWSGEAKEPDEPAKLVRVLRSSAAGCRWMRDRWKELRAFLEQPKGFWSGSDLLKAVRLLGRHPIHAQDDRRVAEIFAATYALRPSGGEAFDHLRTDMGYETHENFVKTIKARWPDLVGTKGAGVAARQILLDLVDENIARIESRLKKHLKNPEKKAERSLDRLGVEKSRDGELFLRYELRFSNAAKRGLYDLQKYQEKRKKYGNPRDRYNTPGYEPAVPRRARRAAGHGLSGAGGTVEHPIELAPEPDLSWLAESGEVTPTLPSPTKGEGVWATDTVAESHEDTTPTAAAAPRPEDCRETGKNEANFTNEAIVYENVFVSKFQENVDVVADSDVSAGLDKLETKPFGDEQSADLKTEISNPEFQEPDEESGGGGAASRGPRLRKWARRRKRKEMLRRAAEHRLMAQLDELPSEAAQLAYLIKEMRANSPADVDALLPLGMPRAP